MVSNGSTEGPTGGFHRRFGRRFEEGITDGQKPRSRTQSGVRGPLLAVRKETRSKVDCAGVGIAKNYLTRPVSRLVLPFHSVSVFIHALYSYIYTTLHFSALVRKSTSHRIFLFTPNFEKNNQLDRLLIVA